MALTKLPKLLVLIDWFSPGFKAGGPIRSVENIIFLLRNKFDVYVLTSDKDFGEKNSYSNIVPNQWIRFDEQIKVCYLSSEKQNIKTISQQIKAINPDTIYLNSMYSLVFTIYPLLLNWLNTFSAKLVLAPRGMLKESALKFKKGKKSIYLKVFKFLGVYKKLYYHATDELEVEDIKKKLSVKSCQIFKISNPPKTNIDSISPILKRKGAAKLIYIARIHPIKNLLFLLKQLAQTTYQMTLEVYGPIEDKQYWQKCSEQISNLPDHIQVKYHGPIEHKEVSRVLAGSHFLALPTQGENFGHSIFESFAVGRPVLISNQTPWNNLAQKKIGWDLPLEEPHKFIDAIQAMALMNQADFDLMSNKTWQFAKDYINKSNLKEQYFKLFT